MRELIIGCLLLVLMASCGGKKKQVDPFETLTEQIDSAMTIHSDSVCEKVDAEEEAVPVAADESFADFFYNFASDESFQRKRVVFPCPFYVGKVVKRIARDEWKYDPLFSCEPVYTVLFDSEEEMEVEKDTSIHSVQVDWIYLSEEKVQRYYFERKDNRWYLEAVDIHHSKAVSKDSTKEDFLTFYENFSRDSVFQRSRLHNPLTFVTSDPEDEFQILETTLDEGQWFAFRPPMMKDRLTNVHYGQSENKDSDTKIVEFKGFGNGFNNTLYFKRRHGIWKLMEFEDLSD